MRLIFSLFASTFLVSFASAKSESIVVERPTEFSAGAYDFHASRIAFRGRSLGYASADFKPQQFSSNFWVYFSCAITRKDPAFDGECTEWKMLNTATGIVTALNLPELDSFWTVPTFSWPFVAYVEIEKSGNARGTRSVYCILYDYRKKVVVQRQPRLVPEAAFATDFPHMFTPPQFREKSGTASVAFGFDFDGNRKPICEIPVPK